MKKKFLLLLFAAIFTCIVYASRAQDTSKTTGGRPIGAFRIS